MFFLLSSHLLFFVEKYYSNIYNLTLDLLLVTSYQLIVLKYYRGEAKYVWVKYLAPRSQMPLYINDENGILKEFALDYLKTGKFIRKLPKPVREVMEKKKSESDDEL